MNDDRRMIGVRLNVEELRDLNIYLKSNGYNSLSDFCHSIIQGKFTRQELTEAVSTAVLKNVNYSLHSETRKVEITNEIIEKGASTATSRGLTHLTNMTATCGLTSGFGMRPGRARTLWPASILLWNPSRLTFPSDYTSRAFRYVRTRFRIESPFLVDCWTNSDPFRNPNSNSCSRIFNSQWRFVLCNIYSIQCFVYGESLTKSSRSAR